MKTSNESIPLKEKLLILSLLFLLAVIVFSQ
jgi:hypothetical protein